MADVMEVIEVLKNIPEYKGVEELRKKKYKERGGFEEKIILKGQK